MNGTVRYWANAGGGRFDHPRPMPDAPAGFRLADPGVQLVDADGDGRIDLLVAAEGLRRLLPAPSRGGWNRSPSGPTRPRRPRPRRPGRAADRSRRRRGRRRPPHGRAPRALLQRPRPAAGAARTARAAARETFPDVAFSDPRVRLADMNGDGLLDIVCVSDGSVEYWPNLGHGAWARRIVMRGGPRLPDESRSAPPVARRRRRGRPGRPRVRRRRLRHALDQPERQRLERAHRHRGHAARRRHGRRAPRRPPRHRGRRRPVERGSGRAGSPGSFFLDLTGGAQAVPPAPHGQPPRSPDRGQYAPSTAFLLAERARRETRWRTTACPSRSRW